MGMPSIIRNSLILCSVVLTSNFVSAQLKFDNLSYPVIEVDAPASTGLNKLYVVESIKDASISYASSDAEWTRFSAMGAAYGEPAESTVNGDTSVLKSPEGNVGYAINSGGKVYYYWIIDHSSYPFALRDLKLNREETECSTTWLDVDGEGERLPYYSITGIPQWLSRDLQLTYFTLEFDTESFNYVQIEKTETLEGFTDELIHCNSPLCQTDFTLSGDRFMRQWGRLETIVSPVYDPIAVGTQTKATQTERNNDNEVKVDAALGGSGPVEVTFEGVVTDAALFHEWEFARDADFQQTFLRSSDLDFTYTFREQGTVYVRMNVANDDGSCDAQGDTYEVFVGESQLKCPNAFSPGTSPGINDEWKVSYKSITEFECHIFDRHGRQLAHLTDPSQGWDGTRNGKTVGSGVYFYVIRAKGADGKKYNLKGDINVVGHKQTNRTSNATE